MGRHHLITAWVSRRPHGRTVAASLGSRHLGRPFLVDEARPWPHGPPQLPRWRRSISRTGYRLVEPSRLVEVLEGGAWWPGLLRAWRRDDEGGWLAFVNVT